MRLIDADEARETMLKLLDHHLMMCNYSADSATQDCIEVINEATVVDAEPVVRCKDCECWECEQDTKGEIYKSHLCDVFECGTTAYDFCSYGERKGKVSE